MARVKRGRAASLAGLAPSRPRFRASSRVRFGTVEQRHDGKYLIQLGDSSEVVARPRHKDLDVQMVLDLRRMLAAAGYDKVVEELESKGKEV